MTVRIITITPRISVPVDEGEGWLYINIRHSRAGGNSYMTGFPPARE